MKATNLFLVLLLTFILPLCHYSQSNIKISDRCRHVIDSTYSALIKKNKVVGASIAIIDKGEIVYTAGYGFSDKKRKVLANDKTIYRIGSCTKSFTSLSILQLQEKKLLDITHSVKEYLPDLHIKSRFNDTNEFYIHEMLSHVSGLPCDITNGFFCDAPPNIHWEILELNKQTTISPRRYKHAYSNVAYGLLGEVIARQANTKYPLYLEKNIFEPLNMTSSFVEMDDRWAGDFSKAYVDNKEINEPLIRDQAAGLIHSNVIDMANYVLMYLNKGKVNQQQLISEASINTMCKNQIEDIYLYNGESWGYGLYSKKIYCKENKDSALVNLIGHGGDTYAFHADFGFIPELNLGAVILTNTDNGTRMNSVSKLLGLYLKETSNKKLNVNFVDEKLITQLTAKDQACLKEERRGDFNLGQFIIQVKDPHKIKFKQGPATLVLKPLSPDTNNYKIKANLFGFIPFKVKGQELKFVKRDQVIFIKGLSTKDKEEDYIAIKSPSKEISSTWKNALGNYTVENHNYTCTDCPYMNTAGLKMKLKIKNGFLVLKTKAKSSDMNSSSYLDVVSDSISVTGGIGRGTGETVSILKNGNIYYSGFELKKVK